jgi:hypothetical protein
MVHLAPPRLVQTSFRNVPGSTAPLAVHTVPAAATAIRFNLKADIKVKKPNRFKATNVDMLAVGVKSIRESRQSYAADVDVSGGG